MRPRPLAAAWIARLFPGGVAAAEVHGRVAVDSLLPAERACVARAASSRAEDFAAGRLCAHEVLRALGLPRRPLVARQDRVPVWPPGAIGAISHTGDYCVAVAARTTDLLSLGIDAERIDRIQSRLWPRLLRTEEMDALRQLSPSRQARIAAAMFSAKEAFYKCQYPLTRSWLGFHDVAVQVSDDSCDFTITVRAADHPAFCLAPMQGRFALAGALVVAGVALPGSASHPYMRIRTARR